jgi:thiol-disulfide isomerase/thioredoxin
VTTRAILAVLLAASATATASPPRPEDAPVSRRMRGREIAAELPALDNPACRSAASATHMREEDLVLGVAVSGRARAYPWWVAKNYHVVNDTIGGTPIVVAFCEQCSGGAAFRRQHKGRLLSLDVAGVYNGTILLKDRETGSLWAPFSGRALEGPLRGEKLDRVPLSITHWDEWSARHPQTDVVWASPNLRSGHGSWYGPGKWGIVTEMGATLESWDARLPENTMVYGVESGPNARAYPLATVGAHQGVVNDQLGPTPVVVVAKGDLEAAGFDRRAKGHVLSFRPVSEPDAVMIDGETGSSWSREGEAIRGALRGQRLEPLDGYAVEWHVWSAYNPRTEIFEPSASSEVVRIPEGLRFPELSLQGLDGGTAQAPSLAGEINLVSLWAAWCPPCRTEMAAIQRLVEKDAARGLTAVGLAIHIPEAIERAAVKRFVAEARITFPTFLVDDPSYEQLDALARRLGGPGVVLPTVFVTDRQAKVLAVLRGKDVDTLPNVVETLLDSRSAVFDLEGHAIRPLESPSAKAVVLVFVRTDCPISNRYAPELRRLSDRFAERGVEFWMVYSDPRESAETIAQHVREYGHPGRAVRDPGHALVRAAAATVTPEAAIFVPAAGGPRLVYHGRIDDRYLDFDRMRATPANRDLEEAIEAVLAGRPVTAASAPAVGCFLSDLQPR